MLLVPVAACLLIAAGAAAWRVSLGAACLNLVLAAVLAGAFSLGHEGYQFVTNVPWFELSNFFKVRFHLGVDGLSLALVLLTTLVTLAAVGASKNQSKREAEFHINLQLIALGALGAFLSLDLFFLYVFHEIALIPTFLLIGIWGGQNRKYAASQMAIYLTAGSLVLMVGIFALYFALPPEGRSLDIEQIRQWVVANPLSREDQQWVAGFMLLGLGVLVSLFPFHSWAPQGYASAPSAAAMLHAGVLKKFGLYALLRIGQPIVPQGMEMWSHWLQYLLLGNILYIGWVTLAQKELNLMLGYSSVMHMGYLFLGLMAATTISTNGVVLLMVGHGLSAALLFALAGEIGRRCGTTRLDELGGLARQAPKLAFVFCIGAFASIGLPGLANFAGEIMIFFGSWKGYPWITLLALWGMVISSVYMLRAVRRIFFGDLTLSTQKLADAACLGPHIMLCAALVLVGCYPTLILQWLGRS